MKVPTENYTDEQLQAAFVEMRHRAVANIKVNREARGDYSSSWEQGYLDGQKWCEDEIKDIPACAGKGMAEFEGLADDLGQRT